MRDSVLLATCAFCGLTLTASLGFLRADDAVSKPTAAKPQLAERQLSELHLSDYRGRVWELEDFKEQPIVVIAFLGVECPLAKLYSQRLSDLHAEFSAKGVAFIGADANPQDSLNEMAAHARRHSIEFPLLRDAEQKLVHALGATRTPEVFVLDRLRRVCYQGRIDDQYGIGYVRDQPQTHALRNAIESLSADREILVRHEPAVGCLIGKLKPASAVSPTSVTYSMHIAPLFRDACVQCHREGEIAPFPLTEYSEIAGWAETIAEVVSEQRMPPWHANPAYGKFANTVRSRPPIATQY